MLKAQLRFFAHMWILPRSVLFIAGGMALLHCGCAPINDWGRGLFPTLNGRDAMHRLDGVGTLRNLTHEKNLEGVIGHCTAAIYNLRSSTSALGKF